MIIAAAVGLVVAVVVAQLASDAVQAFDLWAHRRRVRRFVRTLDLRTGRRHKSTAAAARASLALYRRDMHDCRADMIAGYVRAIGRMHRVARRSEAQRDARS